MRVMRMPSAWAFRSSAASRVRACWHMASIEAHIDLEARARSRFGTSPCAQSIQVDLAVHRVLPAMIRERFPLLAGRLEDTSPRWGRRARLQHAAQHVR